MSHIKRRSSVSGWSSLVYRSNTIVSWTMMLPGPGPGFRLLVVVSVFQTALVKIGTSATKGTSPVAYTSPCLRLRPARKTVHSVKPPVQWGFMACQGQNLGSVSECQALHGLRFGRVQRPVWWVMVGSGGAHKYPFPKSLNFIG